MLDETVAEPLGPPGNQAGLWRRVLDDVAVGLASETVGATDRALEEAQLDAVMLLQIHDELIFEVRRSDLPAAGKLVRDHMESAITLSVPLEVTLKSGRNWYDVEAYDAEALERV